MQVLINGSFCPFSLMNFFDLPFSTLHHRESRQVDHSCRHHHSLLAVVAPWPAPVAALAVHPSLAALAHRLAVADLVVVADRAAVVGVARQLVLLEAVPDGVGAMGAAAPLAVADCPGVAGNHANTIQSYIGN